MNKYIRNCPGCDKELVYKHKIGLRRGIEGDTKCKSCNASGENNPMYGVERVAWNKGLTKETDKRVANQSEAQLGSKLSEETKDKIRQKAIGRKPSDETRMKMRISHWGKKHTAESIKKNRLSNIKTWSKKFKVQPNYNPEACKIIDNYGKENGYNFQHAENGGEHHIKELGYWVDGYDKDKNVVVEYYENYHTKQTDKDKRRKQEIINLLGCKFIELKEWQHHTVELK
ncbi:MAG: hypothetical protein H8D94_00560 [Candidatus Pelagibacter sp.]|nr:hypothetical protein [Candidatus Pelagibacter sp.]